LVNFGGVPGQAWFTGGVPYRARAVCAVRPEGENSKA